MQAPNSPVDRTCDDPPETFGYVRETRRGSLRHTQSDVAASVVELLGLLGLGTVEPVSGES